MGRSGAGGALRAVLAYVEEMKPYLIGANPGRIEDIWTLLYRAGFYRGGGVLMSAISGIDQALWDMKGKTFGVPVYELMGGACRDRMKVYSWIGGDRPSDVGKGRAGTENAGFQAVKMNATEELQMIDSYDKIDAVLERVAAIREQCGKYFGIAIDFHGRVHSQWRKSWRKNWKNLIRCLLRSRFYAKIWNTFLKSPRRVIFQSPPASGCSANTILNGC